MSQSSRLMKAKLQSGSQRYERNDRIDQLEMEKSEAARRKDWARVGQLQEQIDEIKRGGGMIATSGRAVPVRVVKKSPRGK